MIDTQRAAPFWQSGWLWLALALASALPFLFITVLPFNDILNHVGRHYVFLNAAHDPFLQQNYSVHWSLIGNLGIDVIVRVLGPLLGAERATLAAVGAVPPLTIAGIYCLSRALNGEVTPAALAATPLAFNWPLIMGFGNFSIAAAIALLVLALWIRLRDLYFLWRFALFAPLAFGTWVAHTAGWGLLCIGIGAYEVARATQNGLDIKRLLLAPLQSTPFMVPIVFIVSWRQGTSSGVSISFADDILRSKAVAVASLFREHNAYWDIATTLIFGALLLFFLWKGGWRLIWTGAMIAFVFLVAFLLCPNEVFKSAFADRRLLTYAVMMVPLAIGIAPGVLDDPRRRRALGIAAMACVVLFGARVAVSTVVWHEASQRHERRLALIDQVPRHSRVFGLVIEGCDQQWNRIGRPDHLQQYALTRRDSIVNGMFQNPGLNQVEALFARPDAPFDPNMYAVLRDESCPVDYIPMTLQQAMAAMDRDAFDYVWLIGVQPGQSFDTSRLALVAEQDGDRLYWILPASN